MASGFIGQIEFTGQHSSGAISSSTLSYSAPSSVSYSVVSISESASVSMDNSATEGEARLTGFSVSATTSKYNNIAGNGNTATSNDIRLILGPTETVTIQATFDVGGSAAAKHSYTGSMSVLEVN